MAIPLNDIVVGRRYCTAENEIRRVTTIEDGDVVYTSVAHCVEETELAHFTHKRLPLARFAFDAVHEMTPSNDPA